MKMDTQPAKTPKELIATISKTQVQLEEAKTKLANIIDTLAQNPSSFNYLTQKWHQLSPLYKIVLASAVAIPLLLIGMLTQLAVLTALGSALCLFVGVTVYFFENHKDQTELNKEQLKKPIECMVELLEILMQTIAASSVLLAKEVEKLQSTNDEVSQRCSLFSEEINQLKNTNTLLDKDLKELLSQHTHLKSTLKTVDETVLEQRATLERCQKALDETMAAYQKNQLDLSTKINELTLVKQSLASEVERVQQLGETLKKTVQTFTQVTLTKDQQSTEFLTNFQNFLTNQEVTLKRTTQSIIDSGAQLEATAIKMESHNKRFEGLLDKQEQVISELDHLVQQPQKKPEASQLKAPVINGLFQAPKVISMLEQPPAVLVYG